MDDVVAIELEYTKKSVEMVCKKGRGKFLPMPKLMVSVNCSRWQTGHWCWCLLLVPVGGDIIRAIDGVAAIELE